MFTYIMQESDLKLKNWFILICLVSNSSVFGKLIIIKKANVLRPWLNRGKKP